jgi:hypothetical protein
VLDLLFFDTVHRLRRGRTPWRNPRLPDSKQIWLTPPCIKFSGIFKFSWGQGRTTRPWPLSARCLAGTTPSRRLFWLVFAFFALPAGGNDQPRALGPGCCWPGVPSRPPEPPTLLACLAVSSPRGHDYTIGVLAQFPSRIHDEPPCGTCLSFFPFLPAVRRGRPRARSPGCLGDFPTGAATFSAGVHTFFPLPQQRRAKKTALNTGRFLMRLLQRQSDHYKFS